MSGEGENADKLQALRDRITSAATPSERLEAQMLLADELSLSDPVAAKPLLEQLIAEAGTAGETKAWADATNTLSDLLMRAGDLDGSARHAELLLRYAEATGDRAKHACALHYIGEVHLLRGEYQRALECHEEQLRISREIGFRNGESSALGGLAAVYAQQGDHEKVLVYLRESLELSIKAGAWSHRAASLLNIGVTLKAMGRWTEATEHYHRAIALSEEHNDRDALLLARYNLGVLSLRRSDCDGAARTFQAIIAAERDAKRTGRTFRLALCGLGNTHFSAGDLARAGEALDEAAQVCEATLDRYVLAFVGCSRADLALAQGRLDEAGKLLTQAARHATDLNLLEQQAEVLRLEALLAAARGNTGQALELFVRSEATFEPFGDTNDLALTRLQHSRLLIELGRSEQALPLLQASARTFRRLGVVAEGEEASRLLYQIEARTNRDSALLSELLSIRSLALAPERFVERALSMLCESLRFEQGCVLVGDRPVALKGRPDLAELPGERSSLSQTDNDLVLPVSMDHCVVGSVWLRWAAPNAARAEAGLLELVSYMLAPSLAKLAELETIESRRAPDISGLRYRGLVGRNREVLELMALVPRVAATDVPVLVRGESGSGKELIARALHESGPRADHPFVTVNCAAVPESMLEAEFFGVEAGAATGVASRPGKFELAESGTIFLDEIGDMSPALQAKLLRVIEEKTVMRVGGAKETPVESRVVAATNMDLDLREREGLFRRDLLYRLNTVQFVLPPLRRRPEDVPVLTQYFITRSAQKYGRNVRQASPDVLALFADYHWPGNIRQLQHVIERAVILSAGSELQVSDLPPELRQYGSTASTPESLRSRFHEKTDESERAMLVEALRLAKGNMSEAIRLTGFSERHFYRLLRKHHLSSRSVDNLGE
jgi:DNA-binding NtrC family response regulator/tetratricopeptide (TPR) repeat protein